MEWLHRQVTQNPEGHDDNTDRADDPRRESEPRWLLAPAALHCTEGDPNDRDERGQDHQQVVVRCLKQLSVQS